MMSYVLGQKSGGGSSTTILPLDVTENGTYTAPSGSAYSPVTVDVSSSPVEEKDVDFIDYDGTLLYSYSADDFLALSAMPANPTHAGLIAQGWNWSLADAKAYVQSYGMLDIGQMYITASGATEIDIELPEGWLEPYLGLGLNGTAVIDWGDGSTPSTVTGTNIGTVVNTQHVYAAAGAYTIKVTVTGSAQIVGNSTYYSQLLWAQVNIGNAYSNNAPYRNAIRHVRIGNNMRIYHNAFYYCYSLRTITIPIGGVAAIGNSFYYCYSLVNVTLPNGATGFNDNVFRDCSSLLTICLPPTMTATSTLTTFYLVNALQRLALPDSITSIAGYGIYNCISLERVVIPNNVTQIGTQAFNGCRSINKVRIPNKVTTIGDAAFQNCNTLTSIKIPNSVTSIGNSAFRNCPALAYCDMSELDHVPSLTGSGAFSSTPPGLKIYVPSTLLSEFQSATNWSAYASQMVGV